MATKKQQRKGWIDKQYENRIRSAQSRSESGNTHWFTQKVTKKYQTRKDQAMMEYMVSGSRNSTTLTTD